MQLTVGDTINVGVRLYRLNWKRYLKLSLIAHLWLLMPIYGWGKHLAIASQIADLGYKQLIDADDSSPSKPAALGLALHFFLTSILVTIFSYLYVVIIFIILFFLLALLLWLLANIFAVNTRILGSFFGNFLLIPAVILFYIAIFFLMTWIYSRLFLTDPVLSIESSKNFLSPISRSYLLTKGSQLKIIKIIWLAFAVTIPIIVAIYLSFGILTGFIIALLSNYYPERNFSGFVAVYVVLFFSSTNFLITPFWQSIKAIVYYQTRCDREGIDLTLNIEH